MYTHEKFDKVRAAVVQLMNQEPFNNGSWLYGVIPATCETLIWHKDRDLAIRLQTFLVIDTLDPERLTDLAANGLAALAAAQREIQGILRWNP